MLTTIRPNARRSAAPPADASHEPTGRPPSTDARGSAQVVALTGAVGGLGVSALLLHLARASAALGRRVAVLDLDPAGCLGTLLGDESRPGLRWADLPVDETAFRADLLVAALPTWIGMPVLTGDERGGPLRPEQAGPALAVLAEDHDLVLVDLPRGATPPTGARVLLVTGTDLRTAVAAQAISARFEEAQDPAAPGGTAPPLSLVLRDGTQDLDEADLVTMTGGDVLARLPTDRSVPQHVERGDDPTRGRGGVRRCARVLAALLAEEHEDSARPGAGPDARTRSRP